MWSLNPVNIGASLYSIFHICFIKNLGIGLMFVLFDPPEESPLGQTLPPGFPAPFLFADGLSSVETLLTNIQVWWFQSIYQVYMYNTFQQQGNVLLVISCPTIQGLLKVAVENARAQDKQIQAEKRELKMELYREREMRESLERQLNSELQSRGWKQNSELLKSEEMLHDRHVFVQLPSRNDWRRRRRRRESYRRRWSSSPRGGRELRMLSNTRPLPPRLLSRCTPPTTTPRTVRRQPFFFFFCQSLPMFVHLFFRPCRVKLSRFVPFK